MKIPFLVFFCSASCVTSGLATDSSITESTTAISPKQSNWEDVTPNQSFKETTNAKRNKFSRVLNLLQNTLSEELENPQFQIIEEVTKDSILSSLNSILEEEEMNRDDVELEEVTKENFTDPDNIIYKKIVTKFGSAFSKTQNVTKNQNNGMPTMIPIFRPRQIAPGNQIPLNQNKPNSRAIPKTKQILKSRAVSFVPEKIVQTNVNPIPRSAMFNIPCQRAADVLDMKIAIPKEAMCKDVNVRPIVNPIAETLKYDLPSQIPAPVTLSVHSAESDDTVAMLFKPKNISLMQLYGNLLKKTTLTVLVPYHMSKLGGKSTT